MKFWYQPNFLAVLSLVILALFALKSLILSSGFYTSHDGETHTARIAQYFLALKDGQIPPRLAKSFYNGLGSPIFVYIYPIPYLLGSALHFIGFSFVESFKIEMALGFIFSGIFCYLWLKELTGSTKGGFIGALYYVWVPYRLSLIYVRGSLSEVLAYTFLPLAFYCQTKLIGEKNWFWMAMASFSVGLILLSQNLVALISLPVLMAYVGLLSFSKKSLFTFLRGLVTFIWGLAVAAVTYAPSLFERNFVRLDETISTAYINHFVTLKQLIYSPWGYGFDLPGTVNDQMSFQIGLAHIGILLLVAFLIIYKIVKKYFPWLKLNFLNESDNLVILEIFFGIILIITVVLMIQTEVTVYIWQHIKQLSLIDLPWRFLGISTLAIAFMAASIGSKLKSGFLLIFLIAAVLVANRNHLRVNQNIVRDDNFFANYAGTATQYNEFTPKWRQTTRVPVGFEHNTGIQVIAGDAKIIDPLITSNKIVFETNVESNRAQVRINEFYFPDWKVTVDERQLRPFGDLVITDAANARLDKEQDSSGLMQLNLEKGKHQISAMFSETNLRLVGDLLSLISVMLVLGIVLKNAKV